MQKYKLMPRWLCTRPGDTKGPAKKLRYVLPALWAERREKGWYVARAVPVFSEGMEGTPKWHGPFPTVEAASRRMAQHFGTLLTNAHAEGVEYHKLDHSSPIYGADVPDRAH